MNLNIGILLSAVSGIASPANCSAVWYVYKHPLVCAVFISISPLTLFGILLGTGSLVSYPFTEMRSSPLCPIAHADTLCTPNFLLN